MLGFLALGLTAVMIYTLVKNALIGTQLGTHDAFHGPVELIIPMNSRSEFFLEPWLKNLNSFHSGHDKIKIHILVDGHHPMSDAWQELHQKLPYVELHSFPLRPLGRESIPWMIEQIAPQIKADVVIIGDAELVADEAAFLSVGHLVSQKQRPYFILPQTAKLSILGEAVALLNPTLALASVYGFRKMRRNFSHPLVSIADGWMGMPLKLFKEFEWDKINISSWKEALAKSWDMENKTYLLSFGEKHLIRYYPENLKIQIQDLVSKWDELWNKGERTGLILFLVILFIWSFPILCLASHPFWAMASLLFLVLYRFFTKIVFQESFSAILLHPVGCLIWLGTFIWWGISGLKTKFHFKTRTGN